MPRQPRIFVPHGLYHVTTRGIADRPVFVSDPQREWFLQKLGGVVERHHVACLSYCLMRTHYHLLLEVQNPGLDAAIQELNGTYAQYFNRDRGSRGHVWGGRYGAKLIESEFHGLEVGRYIALNPQRAGACERAEDWPWSSYASSVGFAPPDLFVDDTRLLEPFGPSRPAARRRFRRFVEEADPRRRRGQTRV